MSEARTPRSFPAPSQHRLFLSSGAGGGDGHLTKSWTDWYLSPTRASLDFFYNFPFFPELLR